MKETKSEHFFNCAGNCRFSIVTEKGKTVINVIKCPVCGLTAALTHTADVTVETEAPAKK